MLKVMLAAALLTGLNWYSDSINCVMKEELKKEIGGFVSSACWINGLYIYKDLPTDPEQTWYYGMPKDINLDGRDSEGRICATTNAAHTRNPDCKPLTKIFYVQYQYVTFLLTALALVYYLPYAVFRKVNEDKTSLKTSIAGGNAGLIVDSYFNESVNPRSKLRLRVLGDVLVKVLYIVSTISVFCILDSSLNGDFAAYGGNWLNWSKLSNALAYGYMNGRLREGPKPGNQLLPSYGFCEVHESAMDVKHVLTDKHKFMCELSQHILYQYIFIIMWFVMVASIVVSVVGLILLVAEIFSTIYCRATFGTTGEVYDKLTLREVQYMEFIRRKNVPLYGDVLAKLKEIRFTDHGDDEAEKAKLIK